VIFISAVHWNVSVAESGVVQNSTAGLRKGSV
jgi:hypothetical protein